MAKNKPLVETGTIQYTGGPLDGTIVPNIQGWFPPDRLAAFTLDGEDPIVTPASNIISGVEHPPNRSLSVYVLTDLDQGILVAHYTHQDPEADPLEPWVEATPAPAPPPVPLVPVGVEAQA